jgi:hypothetical protein
VFLYQRSAYGERKTARILTGTPIPVNTTKTPVASRAAMIYPPCGHFKQTFVLDLPGGVDIMRAFEMTPVEASLRASGLHAAYKKILLSPE